METGNEGDDDEEDDEDRMHTQQTPTHSNSNPAALQRQPTHDASSISHPPEFAVQRERTIRPSPPPSTSSAEPRAVTNVRVNGQTTVTQNSNVTRRTPARGFGHQPIVETSTSPTPSDVASNRSTGTNQSNGAFFRTYQEAASSSRSNGAQTPDLIFAEIGHGRGAGNNTTSHMNLLTQSHARRGLDPVTPYNVIASSSSHGITQAIHASGSLVDVRNGVTHDRTQILADSSNSYHRSSDGLVTWPHLQGEPVASSRSSSPTTRELHDSVQSALGATAQESRETAEGRGRRVKRSLRNTINAAENYASSFLFGRGTSSGVHDGNAGWSNGVDSGQQRR
jgi:F-box and leucine-rich repeat protein GRR1